MKISLALPLLGKVAMQQAIAGTPADTQMHLPNNIQQILLELYGDKASYIQRTDRLQLKGPKEKYAGNSWVVPIGLQGEKGLVSSVALFVAGNDEPLVQTTTLSKYIDIPLNWRIRVKDHSDVILVAETDAGLLGVKTHVKVWKGGDSCS